MRLTASTSPQTVRERLGAGDAKTLRESEKRRRYLQKYVRLLTPIRPTVRFASELRTAVTGFSADHPEIAVTTREFDQPVTDLRRRVFDLAVQEALVVHEIGHLRYTDIDGFHDLLADTAADRRRLFARVWNTLEDGAIERQLRHRYAVATELDILNANLFGTDTLGRETPDGGGRRFSFFHAVICGLADMAVYDSGRFQRLRAPDALDFQMASLRDRRALEEFLPAMRETVREVLSEPDPAARNERIWTFWTALGETLDETPVSGAGASELARLIDADGTVRTGSRRTAGAAPRATDASILPEDGAGSPLPGKPDDTTGEFGQTTHAATDLSRDPVVREVTRQVRTAAGSEDSTESGDSPPGDTGDSTNLATETRDDAAETGPSRDSDGVTPGSEPSQSTRSPAGGSADHPTETGSDEHGPSPSHPGAGQLPGEAGAGRGGPDAGSNAAAIREQYAEELAAEATELDRGTTRLAALDEYVDALQAADTDTGSLQVVTDDDNEVRAGSARWQSVLRDATRLARRFRTRLQEQQRDVERSHRRRGAFDRSRLVAAARGQSTVFTQKEEGDDKQYTCIVVVDRSGSMDNGAVTAAETGALTTAVALETVGVSVTILDLYDSEVRLIKTHAEETREARNRVLTKRASGGTPLTDALSLVRARFQDAENPFVIVVTDGQPDDTETYTAELDAATCPILGVYLATPDQPDRRPVESDRSYFHRLAVVEDWSSLDRRLQQLAGGVLF